MGEKGRISVIIPAYNVEHFLWDAIRSVTGQSYRDLEILDIEDLDLEEIDLDEEDE